MENSVLKPFLFITDFDGTVTAQDFYLQIMYRYQHNKIFLENKKRGVELLIDVLENARLSEEDFLKEIEYIPMDPTFPSFYEFIKDLRGEILILSAGVRYYIEKKLCLAGVKDAFIIANDGFYKDGKFKFIRNKDEKFSCDIFGIEKRKVVEFYRNKYKTIFYAGDSYVDFNACKICDVVFAKKKLAEILNMFGMDFYKFKNFDDVRKVLSNLLR